MSVKAAVATGLKEEGKLAEVASIPKPTISSKQILIKSVAFAVNPTDWKHLTYGFSSKGDIVGSDVSGIVEEVGADVTGFAKGDYVSATMHGNVSTNQGAFAEYAVADTETTLKHDASNFTKEVLPVGEHASSAINSFEAAASATLGLITVSLSFSHSLKIDPATAKEKAILIWGGASATGIIAIQIAKLAFGLTVITTASPQNHEFLKSLGADHVFNYKDADVVDQIKKVGNNKIFYGLDTIGSKETFQGLYDATEGADNVALDNLLSMSPGQINTTEGRTVTSSNTLAYKVLGTEVKLGPHTIPADVEGAKNYLKFWQEVIPQYVSQVKTAKLKVLPAGLESTNEALELLKQNKVRGEKVVWRI